MQLAGYLAHLKWHKMFREKALAIIKLMFYVPLTSWFQGFQDKQSTEKAPELLCYVYISYTVASNSVFHNWNYYYCKS